jgi:hypothetical protein
VQHAERCANGGTDVQAAQDRVSSNDVTVGDRGPIYRIDCRLGLTIVERI